jgi:cephalosporin hydroxylase
MFTGMHDVQGRDTERDWGKTTVKTPQFDPTTCPVWAQQNPWELAQLLRIYAERKPQRVVEIGTHSGGTLYHWLQQAAEGSKIVSVDLPELYDPAQQRAFSPEQWGEWVRVGNINAFRFFPGDSRDPQLISQVLEFLDGAIDWLFIDGNHFYEPAKADFNNWGKLVSPGGVIVLHDLRPRDLGSCQLWTEIQQAGFVCQELIANDNDAGIGIVYV